MGEVLGIAGEGELREPGEEHSGWYEGGALGADKKVRGYAAAPVILRRRSRRRIFFPTARRRGETAKAGPAALRAGGGPGPVFWIYAESASSAEETVLRCCGFAAVSKGHAFGRCCPETAGGGWIGVWDQISTPSNWL